MNRQETQEKAEEDTESACGLMAGFGLYAG